MLLEILTITTNTAVLSLVGYVIFKFFKFKMDAEKILSECVENIDTNNEDFEQVKKRERLSAVVAGGFSRQYLGKDLELSDIDSMPPEEIKKIIL